jgi:hypothetical protein
MLEACEDRTTPTPVVTIASLGDVNEGGVGATAVSRLTRSETGGTLVVNYALGGTATGGGTDYYSTGTSITFMDGQASVDGSFMLNNDSDSEPTETLIVTVASGTG